MSVQASETILPPDPGLPRPIYRRWVIGVQLFKFLGFVGAIASLAWGWGTPLNWTLLGVGYALTMLGITAGFHRLFSHRSFQARAPLRYTLALLGTIGWQGSVLEWVAVHRQHHRFSDQPGDPHSPHTHAGPGRLGKLKGLWHAHNGWILDHYPSHLEEYVPDLCRDRGLVFLHRTPLVWPLLGIILPTAIGGVFGHGWQGALGGLLWGACARMFLVEQGACTVNSLGHYFGDRPHASRDRSTNFGLLALLTLGDGWHNNHHAFPASARHGMRFWQVDPTFWLIRLWALVGLASNLVLPQAQAARENA
ncbi:MAG TPA: fatty acid desaturase [Oscillatoriaceae cyanobacterium]